MVGCEFNFLNGMAYSNCSSFSDPIVHLMHFPSCICPPICHHTSFFLPVIPSCICPFSDPIMQWVTYHGPVIALSFPIMHMSLSDPIVHLSPFHFQSCICTLFPIMHLSLFQWSRMSSSTRSRNCRSCLPDLRRSTEKSKKWRDGINTDIATWWHKCWYSDVMA